MGFGVTGNKSAIFLAKEDQKQTEENPLLTK